MSLARAFTKRTKRPEVSPPSPIWAQSTRQKGSTTFDRAKISSPVALISTTNMLSYNAPDIRHVSSSSVASTSSQTSGDDSDHSAGASSNASNRSRETLTDASSIESSSPISPEPNHLSCYFQAANSKNLRRSASSSNIHKKSPSLTVTEPVDAPAIPQRALSHSKRAHEQLARKRSLQHLPGQKSPRSSHSSSPRISHQYSHSRSETSEPRRSHTVSHKHESSHSRSSLDMFTGQPIEANHPFGKELEQLSEVAEEFHEAVRDVEENEDTLVMRKKGLVKLCAADYALELEDLYAILFDTRYLAPQMAWI